MVLGFPGSIQVETKTSFQAPGDDSSDMWVNPSKETLIAKPVNLHLSGHHDNHFGMFPQYASDKRRFMGSFTCKMISPPYCITNILG